LPDAFDVVPGESASRFRLWSRHDEQCPFMCMTL